MRGGLREAIEWFRYQPPFVIPRGSRHTMLAREHGMTLRTIQPVRFKTLLCLTATFPQAFVNISVVGVGRSS